MERIGYIGAERAPSPVMLTDPPEVVTPAPVAMVLTDREMAWLANQQRKQLGQRSKYVPHQGNRERLRRRKKMEKCA